MRAKCPPDRVSAGIQTNAMLKLLVLICAAALPLGPLALAQEAPQSSCAQAMHLAGRDQQDTFQAPENALKLVDCLGHEDPAIRDEFAYGAFVRTLRQGDTSPETLRLLTAELSANLTSGGPDSSGFLAPFSVLVLAEIARADRLDPFMTPSERSALVKTGSDYLQGIEDYRGFDPVDGWRHGVAHAADLMMQLSLNPLLQTQDARRMLKAISAQVVPGKAHSYIHGESKRLARPVLYLAMTDLVSGDEWRRWFAALEAEPGDPNWQNPYASLAGLARIHNTENFAAAIFVRATASGEASLAPIAQAAEGVIRSIP